VETNGHRRGSLLVVDDEPTITEVLSRYLERAGYLDALPALHQRYVDGVGGRRPAAYWTWGGLAALAFSTGPLAGAGLAQVRTLRPPAALALAATASVLVADATQMSKAEVERIWLPFVPWILLSCALLPERWRRWGLVLQLATALAVEHLLNTGW
jgi:CheY-like chemotaxis protein